MVSVLDNNSGDMVGFYGLCFFFLVVILLGKAGFELWWLFRAALLAIPTNVYTVSNSAKSPAVSI